jgi:hypothetical protein
MGSIASLETLIHPDLITSKYLQFSTNDLTGDYIDGGTITNFSSTGIKDEATQQILHIDDGGLSVDNIYVTDVEASNINVRNMTVISKLTVQNLHYVFSSSEFEDDLHMGKGNIIHMGRDKVLSRNELGPSVVHSNLRNVGNLEKLTVMGDLTGGYGTLHVNTLDQRVGINTLEPVASLHLVTNGGAELIVDGKKGESYIGTVRKTNLHFGTDALASERQSQLTITTNGNVGVGTIAPTVKLEVHGDIRFAQTTMSSSKIMPDSGYHTRGEIVWNVEPGAGKPVGWVCVGSGEPGAWGEFGTVTQQTTPE